MAVSDAILTRLLSLHPKIIDLSLERMQRLLNRLGNPERRVPPVIHIAGTNGKGSTLAFTRAILEAAGLKVHCYTSPHLVKFHERIRITGDLISEDHLSALLEECELANGGENITFFEITTAAAFLAFSRTAADYLILEVGLGGRLDATNVIDHPVATCVTSIGLDHTQFLGDTLAKIAGEKAGIVKANVPAIIGRMPDEARDAIETVALRLNSPLHIAGQEFDVYSQHGRMVFQDDNGLLDLPLPSLKGSHQLNNAGNAIAIIRALNDNRIDDDAIAVGLSTTTWPARLQRLHGTLAKTLSHGSELWLDGGHNTDAGAVLAEALSAMHDKDPKLLIIIWGMLNTKDATAFFKPLSALATGVITLTIPNEANAISAADLAATVDGLGGTVRIATGVENAVQLASHWLPTARILICGSLYLAGHVLAADGGETMSAVSGVARR